MDIDIIILITCIASLTNMSANIEMLEVVKKHNETNELVMVEILEQLKELNRRLENEL